MDELISLSIINNKFYKKNIMEKEQDIKIGDVVCLKSGSPEMIVSELYSNDDIGCTFFISGGFCFETFSKEVLKKDTPCYYSAVPMQDNLHLNQ